MRTVLTLVVLASGAWMSVASGAAATQGIVNEDFEAPFVALKSERLREGAFSREGALPKGWADNSEFGDTHLRYGAIQDAHAGKQALRIEVQRLEGKAAAQLVRRGVAMKKGQMYSFSIAARSGDSLPFEFGVRTAGKPYTWQVKRVIETTPEWAEWEFTGVATSDDPSAMALLRIDRQGTVEVDDIRIEALSEEEYARRHPIQAGNILESTRFPLGAANGWALPRGEAYAFETAKGELGPSGAAPIILPASSGSSSLLSPPMALRPGVPHTASFWAKSAQPDATVHANLRLTRFRESAPVAAKTFTLTDKWQRFSMTGKTPFSEMKGYLSFSATKDALIDGVQVEEGGKATDYAGQKAAEVCAVPAREYGVFFEGEPLEFKVAATGRWEKGAAIKARIVDLFGRTRDLPPIALAQSPFETKIVAPVAEVPLGFFRLELQAVDAQGKAISPWGESLAARVFKPRFPDEDRLDSPFGIHIGANEKQARLAQSLGFKWIRCHDAAAELTKWYFLEPKKGEWHWQDAKVDLIRKHHLMILGTLDTSPVWASRGDPEADKELMRIKNYVPKDWEGWSNYCRTITARYKGKIDYWEIWNEPYYVGFFRDVVDGKIVHATPEQFSEVVKRAYAAAHESNPGCTVLTAIGTVPKWTAGCVKAGVDKWGELFSHHQYAPQIPGGPNDVLAKSLAAWRAELPEAVKSKISWDTEGNASPQTHTFYSHLPAGEARKDARYFADFIARYYLSTQALGVPKFFLYSFHSHGGVGNPNYSAMNGDGTLQPLAAAVSALAWHIEGKRFVRMAPLSGTAWAYLFTDGTSSVAAIVQAPGKTHRLEKIEGAECRDLCGAPIALPANIGPATCYVTMKGGADALAKSLRAE